MVITLFAFNVTFTTKNIAKKDIDRNRKQDTYRLLILKCMRSHTGKVIRRMTR